MGLGRIKIALLATLLFLGVVVFGYLYWSANQPLQPDPIPENVKQQVDFTLYYPAKLSSDFKFDDIAFDEEAKVLTYKYSSSEKTVFFSIQKKPEDLNYEEFRNTQMTGVREIKSSVGTAYTGTLQSQTVGSILTEQTWILLSAGQNTTIEDLERVASSLAISR